MTTALIYVFVVLYVLAAALGALTWKWLRDNPVLPLNWDYERRYEKPRIYRPAPSVWAASATAVLGYSAEPLQPPQTQWTAQDARAWRNVRGMR